MKLEQILHEALMDEYQARDTYRAVIANHGPARPFLNIVEAEQRHIDALLALYDREGLPKPPAPDPARVTPPSTLREACEAAVEAEIENDARYDRLLAFTDPIDVRSVLQRLQAASRDNHLPAFRRCVVRYR